MKEKITEIVNSWFAEFSGDVDREIVADTIALIEECLENEWEDYEDVSDELSVLYQYLEND